MKYHKHVFQFINNVEESQSGSFTNPKYIFYSLPTSIESNERKFKFQIDNSLSSQPIDKKVYKIERFQFAGYDVYLKDFFVNAGELTVESAGFLNISYAEAWEMYEARFRKNKKFYYRLVLPLNIKLSFDYTIINSRYSNDLNTYSSDSVSVKINDKLFDVDIVKSKSLKRKYLIIDCNCKIDFDKFRDCTFSILTSIGYLCGSFIGDKGYYLAYDNIDMKEISTFLFNTLRKSIKSSYKPIHTNPNGYGRKETSKSFVELKKNLRKLNGEEFSSLCEKVNDSIELSKVLLLIIEASVSSLIFMAGGYAMALESLTDIILGPNKEKINPIKDKETADIIREEFNKIIDQYCTKENGDNIDILKKKIQQINQTTNADRLRKPFELLKINLLPEDIKVLKSRNDFLHGREPILY